MPTDTLYRKDNIEVKPFVFNEQVAEVFADMLRRSIPGYDITLDVIGRLASRYLKSGSTGYDLGCSLGAATLAMRHGAKKTDIHLIGIDNSQAMLNRCRSLIDQDSMHSPVELILADVRDVNINNASMVVLNYTLQFVPPDDRDALLRRISAGLNPGGVLVLSEKIRFDNDVIGGALIGLHEDFKRTQAYTELEISRKREAIENVLVPDTVDALSARLENAGFASHGVWLQQYNFISMLAFK